MVYVVWLVAVLSLWSVPPLAAVDRAVDLEFEPQLYVAADTGWVGDVVAVRIDYREYSQASRLAGFQIDFVLPRGVRPLQDSYGQPDCGLLGDHWVTFDNTGPENRFGSAFLPDGCDPEADCAGVRLIATAAVHLDGAMQLVCNARIDEYLPTGSHPLLVENFLLSSDPRPNRLRMSVGDLFVLGSLQQRPRYSWQIDHAFPQLRLRGVPTATEYGDVVEVRFYLEGSTAAPLRGELIAAIEAELPLRPIIGDYAFAGCNRNWGLSHGGTFHLLPPGCVIEGKCTGVGVRIDVDAGHVGFDSGYPPNWYFRPDLPLFHCDFYFDADRFDTGYTVRVSDVWFEEHDVAAEDIVVSGVPPTPAPTTKPTATATPTPLYATRPCEVTEPGVSIVCVEDVEADAGDEIQVTVRFRSAGAKQAGLEFVIDAPETVAFSTDPNVEDRFLWEKAACWPNPEIGRDNTAFSKSENTVKALVLSFVDLSPLPDDVHLVTCAARIDPLAMSGEYEIHIRAPGGSTPDGQPLPLTTRSGVVRVRGTAVATPTPVNTILTDDPERTPQPAPAQRDTREFADSGVSQSGCQVAATDERDRQAILIALTGLLIWTHRRFRTPQHARRKAT